MSDDLSTARRCGRLRKLLWPKGRKNRQLGVFYGRRWVFAALILLICTLTVAGIALLSGRQAETPGNAGVIALTDFLRIYGQNKEIQSKGPFGELVHRLFNEPFEISMQVQLRSDELKSLGVPLQSLPAAVELKYDMRDLGIKTYALGINMWNAYVIEDSVVTESGDDAQVVADLPEVSLPNEELTLEKRLYALLPFLPDNTDAFVRLLGELADCVPKDSTHERKTEVNSPRTGDALDVTEIVTELDEKALAQTAQTFCVKLQNDKTLLDEAQAFADGFSAMTGLPSVTLSEELARLENSAYKDIQLAWSVYTHGNVPIGVSVSVQTESHTYVFTVIAEFEGAARFERMALLVDDALWAQADISLSLAGHSGTIEAKVSLPDGTSTSVDGTFDYVRYTNNAYGITAELQMPDMPYNGKTIAGSCTLDVRIDVGDGLGSLAESRGWRDIYGKTWKDAS